jgi:rubrerythrin
MDDAMRGLKETGASVSDRELVRLIARHEAEEGSVLARYEKFATDARSPAVRYLADLIIADERRHHRVLTELANAIAWGQWMPVADAVPDLDQGIRDASVLAATRELLEAEQRDHAELKELRKQLRDYRHTTLWDLVADLLMMDTDKHIRILRFLIEHAESRHAVP